MIQNMKTEESSLLHHQTCHIINLPLAVVLLTIPNTQNAWNVFLMLCHCGNTALKECTMPFTAHDAVLPEETGFSI
jgi:hypothetical protein